MIALSNEYIACSSELPLADMCIKYEQDLYDTLGEFCSQLYHSFVVLIVGYFTAKALIL